MALKGRRCAAAARARERAGCAARRAAVVRKVLPRVARTGKR